MSRCYKILSLISAMVLAVSICPVAFAATVSGDVDADGTVTLADARLVIKYAASVANPTSTQKKSADVNGDGVITIEDARQIAATAVGIDTYEKSLIDAGFPLSYIEKLSELHSKYPEWEFEPLVTGLDWAESVKQERTPHAQQLIENDVKSSFKCSCSSCNGVIKESPNWVSASEEAVAYYMDPRNFLDEKHIFQFESTAYDSSQTQSGVETILKGTWMYNSYIEYTDALGNKKTYTDSNGNKIKYSAAIIKAAKDSKMSAYYLASKIYQEVGGTSASGQGGSSGTNSPYNGIYNYYNIGATTGVSDGLKWANGNMRTDEKTTLYKTASTSATKLVVVPDKTQLYYIGQSGDFYKVSVTVSGKSYTGFVSKGAVYFSTTYGRPWTDPYKSIYYGAQYIYGSFASTQYTGYLQKFNVNPKSETLYGHEYMANVRAAAFESESSYSAYKTAGILNTKKVFVIPVFKNMPNGDLTTEEIFQKTQPTLKASACTETSVTLSWSETDTADGYKVYKYDTSSKSYKCIKTTSALTYTDTSLSKGDKPNYRVRAYFVNKTDTTVYSKYSAVLYASTAPSAPTGLALVSKSDSSVKIKWNSVSGAKYAVYRYETSTGKYTKIGATSSTSYTDKTVKSGTSYKYKVRSYITTDSQNFYSAYSSALDVKTSGTAAKATCPYSEPSVLLTNGSTGDSVKWLQWYLVQLGYLSSETDIDGIFGSGTQTAVMSFQKDKALDVDGMVGPATREALKKAYGA